MLPRGHIHPQKNLPKIKVNISMAATDIMPGIIILPLKEVNMTTRGSILKNKSVWMADQRIYINNERKNIWLDLLAKINFFIFNHLHPVGEPIKLAHLRGELCGYS